MSLQLTYEAEAKFPNELKGVRDYKAWAKRFLYRYEHGDKTLTMIQIHFAHEAMEIEYKPK